MIISWVIITILTLGLVIFLLRFLFSRDVDTALGRLNAIQEENLNKETQLTDELRRAQEERNAEVRRGKEEAEALIENAKSDGAKLRRKIEEDSRLEIERVISQAKEEAKKFKEEASGQIQEESLKFALELIQEAFTQGNRKDLQAQFINEIIAEISKLPPEKFAVLADVVKVTSSYPLAQTQRQALEDILTAKTAHAVRLEESVQADLISGLVLDMQGLIIDGTLKNRLRKAVSAMREKNKRQ